MDERNPLLNKVFKFQILNPNVWILTDSVTLIVTQIGSRLNYLRSKTSDVITRMSYLATNYQIGHIDNRLDKLDFRLDFRTFWLAKLLPKSNIIKIYKKDDDD